MEPQAVFGIDLGTTNTVVACSKDGSLPDVVAIRNSLSTPSVVSFCGNSFQVGNQVDMNPEVSRPRQTIRMVKRIMGLPLSQFNKYSPSYSMISYDIVQDKESKNPEGDPLKVSTAKMCAVSVEYRDKQRVFRPELLSGLLLASIKQELVSMYNLGNEIPKVVISVPAYFNTVQRRATEAAGKMGGFNVLRVVNEPTAGAFAYALHHDTEQERNVLVYDFGGGTFDCTALQRQPCEDNGTRMVVLATKGNHILGGEDIDEQIMTYFLVKGVEILAMKDKKLGDSSQIMKLVKNIPSLVVKLRQYACTVKEMMTTKSLQVFKVQLNFAEDTQLENVSFDFTLSELQDIVDTFFGKTEEIVDDVMEASGWSNDMITDLVLLGGSSKLSTIRNSLKSKLMHDGLSVHDHVNPDHAVAVGAAAVARQAAGLQKAGSNRLDRFHLEDKTSYSIGVELSDGSALVVVDKHTAIPAEGISILTASLRSTLVLMNMTEGDGDFACENRQIGTFQLEVHEPGVEFSLHWRIDENFDLHLTASDPVRVQELISNGLDPSDGEYRLTLHLIGLKDNQIAKNAMVIRNMWKSQRFICTRTTLTSELDRLSMSLATLQMNNEEVNYPYVNDMRKWLDDANHYTEENLGELQRRIHDVTTFIKVAKQLKRFEVYYHSLLEDDPRKVDMKPRFQEAVHVIQVLQTGEENTAKLYSAVNIMADLEKELKASKRKQRHTKSTIRRDEPEMKKPRQD